MNPTSEDLPIGPIDHLVILHSDLDENSTRYDHLVAAPSYEAQRIMWLVWSLISSFCAGTVLLVFLGILSSPARKKTFNIYLLCMMAPDLLFSLLCLFTCLQNYMLGYYSSIHMCRWQSFYSMFAIASNAWLNAVVCNQVHNMLICVKREQTYRPPHKIRVLGHAAYVYLWSLFVASWVYIGVPLKNYGVRWWPHQAVLISGVACLPMDFDTTSTIFFYCVFFPCLLGIPLFYTVYVGIDIWHNDLLPRKGKGRQMTIFFLRLILVFLVMWVPAIVLIFILGQVTGPWVAWIGGSWVHFQGAVAALVSLCKPDVFNAVRNFLTCQCGGEAAERAIRAERQARKKTKRDAKRLIKYTKEMQQIQEEMEKEAAVANQHIGDDEDPPRHKKSSYMKVLEEVAQKIEATKETLAQESANAQVGLLELHESNHGEICSIELPSNKRSSRCPRSDLVAWLDQAKIRKCQGSGHDTSIMDPDTDPELDDDSFAHEVTTDSYIPEDDFKGRVQLDSSYENEDHRNTARGNEVESVSPSYLEEALQIDYEV